MTVLSSPLFALRRQRDGLRQKQFSHARARGAGQILGAHDGSEGVAPDSVFKRFPAIGDTPARDPKRG